MDQLELDDRSQREIINEIKEKAAGYTPEWRMDEINPDIGTALALVYAEMYAKTVRNFNQVPLKNRIAFLNQLGAELLPAVPSTGYVAFSLVNDEVPGVEVPAGTIVSADVSDELGIAEFETTNDLYVTPAGINVIYQTNDPTDYIDCIFNSEDETNDAHNKRELVFFHFSGTNLQEHTMLFSHDFLFILKKSAWLELCFYQRETRLVSEDLLKDLVTDKTTRIEYYAEGGFVPFEQNFIRDGRIILYKSDKQPPFARTQIGEKESFVIRFTVREIGKLKNFEIERFLLKAKGLDIPCDTITTSDVECDQKQFYPFGERFALYNEIYFGSDEVFCKKNAKISMSFNVDFVSVPLEFGTADEPIEYKWINDRSSFKPNKEFDVTIEEILWEYYNGSGWTRLYRDGSYSHIFGAENGAIGQYKTVVFTCPDDICPIHINAAESYYIRARVLKINNLFKMKGSYISPVLSNVGLNYSYVDTWVKPDRITITNNIETMDMSYQDMLNMGGFKPFSQTGLDRAAIYFGFHTAPKGAPIKMLFSMRDSTERRSAGLLWEYFDGDGWRPLNMVDQTEGFMRSGIVTIMDNREFTKKKLFGNHCYWMRIVDETLFYVGGAVIRPSILGIHMNVTEIVNVDLRATEYFTMEVYQESMNFLLQNKHITDIALYINEVADLNAEELKRLKAEGKVRCVYDEAGLLSEAWVRWERVDDFLSSSSADRHYFAERTEGYVLFGSGKAGRIPPASSEPNIGVAYKTGGGTRTNLPPGAVRKLDRSIGFISEVSNPELLSGGYDVESLTDAVDRSSAMLRLQGKAVTARDFEELARYATRNVGMVKCFSGYDDGSNRQPGAVTLVVLRKDYKTNNTNFVPVRNEIFAYLKDRIYSSLQALGKFYIIEPKFIELRIRAEISVRDMNVVFAVKKNVQERLSRFLDVMNGNFDGRGWKIGQLPNEIQLRNVLVDIEGIKHIKNIFISVYANDITGWKETDLEIAKSNRYVLPLSGEHEILISMI